MCGGEGGGRWGWQDSAKSREGHPRVGQVVNKHESRFVSKSKPHVSAEDVKMDQMALWA